MICFAGQARLRAGVVHRSCYEGGIGDLDQTQTDYTWDFDASAPLFAGLVSYGAQWKHTIAKKSRGSSEHNSYGSC